MVKGLLGAVIGILMIVFLISPAFAGDVPVVVTAAQIRYEDHSRQIEANGNVVIKYKDILIKANSALFDQDLQMVFATGDVTVSQNGDCSQGERFIYDLRADQGWMRPISTEVTDASMKGPAFFSADLGKMHGDDLFLKHSEFTSCDLAEPHYHFTAEKVEYYSGDRIIFHKAWYWEGKYRLLYFPYLFVSLKEDEEETSPFDVEVGRDSDTGWYLYIRYRFYLNSLNTGVAYTKITEWGGDGLGFKNTTQLSSASKWYQDFYYQDNSDNAKIYDEYKLAFGYENSNNSKLKWKSDVERWFSTDGLGNNDSKLTLNVQGISPYPTIGLSYVNDQDDKSKVLNMGENWSYQTKSKVNINTNGSWYYSDEASDSFTKSFRYYLNATKNWDWSNMALKISNSKVYSTSSTSNQNYLPEITFNIPKLNLPGIGDVVYNGQYTNYQYLSVYNNVITRKQNGERLASNISKSKTLWEKSSLKLYTDSKLRYRYYVFNGVTSDFTGFIEGLNFKKTFLPELSTTVGINYTMVDGVAPSIFVSAYSDYLTKGGSLTNSWAWDGKAFDANLSGGYNFTKSIANPLNLSLTWNQDAKGSINFSTIVYLQDDSYYQTGLGVTTLFVRYLPKDNWRINFGLNYNYQNSSWSERYFESFITQPLSRNWLGRLSARYSDVVGDFSVLNFDLTYDWHCRELKFSYDYIKQTFMMALNFKAFPQANLSTDFDPAGLIYE